MKKITLLFSTLLISSLSFAQTAEEVVSGYIKAVGGKDAIAKIKDLTMNMTGEIQGQSLEVLLQKKPAGKFIQSISVAGMGEVAKTVCDGTKAQMGGMQGSQDITDAEKVKTIALQGAIVPEASYAEIGAKLAYVGKEKVGEVEAHKIEVNLGGTKMIEYYEVSSGYKIRQTVSAETPMGTQDITSEYGDYKEVSGVKLPHKISQDFGMMKFELIVKKAEANSNLSDSLFEIK